MIGSMDKCDLTNGCKLDILITLSRDIGARDIGIHLTVRTTEDNLDKVVLCTEYNKNNNIEYNKIR